MNQRFDVRFLTKFLNSSTK